MRWAALLVAGCTSSHVTEPVPGVQPRTCAANVTLVGASSTHPTEVGPLALDANGANICASLDATQLVRAHLMASTDERPGDASGLAATLERGDYSVILEGWDVSVSDRTFLNVEWSPPAGQSTNVVVWVRAASVPVTTTVALDLFDPLE